MFHKLLPFPLTLNPKPETRNFTSRSALRHGASSPSCFLARIAVRGPGLQRCAGRKLSSSSVSLRRAVSRHSSNPTLPVARMIHGIRGRESCHACQRGMAHMCMGRVTLSLSLYVCLRYAESRHFSDPTLSKARMSHGTCVNESCHVCQRGIAPRYMGRVTTIL